MLLNTCQRTVQRLNPPVMTPHSKQPPVITQTLLKLCPAWQMVSSDCVIGKTLVAHDVRKYPLKWCCATEHIKSTLFAKERQ